MLARLCLTRPLLRAASWPLPSARLKHFVMGARTKVDSSPPPLHGMRVLDRSAFKKTITVVAAKVPKQMVGTLRDTQEVRKAVLHIPRFPHVCTADDDEHRLLLFDYENEDDLPQETRDYLKERSLQLQPYNLQLDYDYWNANEILHAILPEDLFLDADYVTTFETVGHLAHLNFHYMHAECLPWKHIIAQVIIDKNSRIRTVVNKTDIINDSIYRIFPMEILAGEPSTLVTHTQLNCHFTFDFAEVYWNTRLEAEHQRIVDMFKPEDVVADVFAGVGPFALPAASKGCAVVANDLNPNCYKWLLVNIERNKVAELVHPTCMDGREFIREIFNQLYDDPMPPVPPPKLSWRQRRSATKKAIQEARQSPPPSGQSPHPSPARDARQPEGRRRRVTQFVMNLPGTAIDFLDAFRGVLGPENAAGRGLSGIYDSQEKMPIIHCYAFTKLRDEELAAAELRERVETALGAKLVGEAQWYLVRSVAPNKDMYRFSFQLPYEVAYAST
ncbi:hypothetical protein DAEQUDRAFT_808857 [Daedalea quercina L-15889]|uniref:tRNA (guanine(37)-N1)-methyltransferase n=1 Tax=Daedalea quercina L-15889 TaxID=1314783 RepID=A0A165T3Q2_9APHY|nr:hypothetical protein DAEQUDRAFT_808857 [Daedalea quercina L-15889]